MPQLLILAAAAAAAIAGWRFMKREMDRVEARLDRARDPRDPKVARESVPTLERDPETGVYRPRDRA